MDENIFLIDWFSFTSRSLTLTNIQCILGLELQPWETGKGAHGFQKSVYFGSIKIFYNYTSPAELEFLRSANSDLQDAEYLIWCDMSGSGCRSFETFGRGDFYELLGYLLSKQDCNITRLDIAFDDRTRTLDIDTLSDYVDHQWIVTKFRRGMPQYTWDREKGRDYKARTLYFGSEKSDFRVRIYDKAKERGFDDLHWIRCELQFRHDRARAVAEELLKNDVGSVFRGVLVEYLRFVVPSADSNMRRWETLPMWQELLDNAERIKLFKKVGIEYNIENLFAYSVGMAGNAVDTYIRIVGINQFLKDLQQRVDPNKLNPNYKRLIQLYGQSQ